MRGHRKQRCVFFHHSSSQTPWILSTDPGHRLCHISLCLGTVLSCALRPKSGLWSLWPCGPQVKLVQAQPLLPQETTSNPGLETWGRNSRGDQTWTRYDVRVAVRGFNRTDMEQRTWLLSSPVPGPLEVSCFLTSQLTALEPHGLSTADHLYYLGDC